MVRRSLTRLRPAVSLLGLAVLAALAAPAESSNNPYLLVQHQVYEEHQEVLAKDPSKRAVGEQRKDEEELFDFIKDYLFKRGGAAKLNNRTSNGRAQFVGVDTGGARGSANGSAASDGVAKDSGQSDQRYKMHIIKFRLVNGSHPAIAAAARNLQALTMHKKGDYAPQEPSHREQHHANGSSGDNATLVARQWSGRSGVGYRTAHPTHVTTARTDPTAAPPRRAAAVAADNCEQPETTKRTTTRRTTTRTTTTTTTTKRTTTTPKPTTTTTRRTTTCPPTTVAVVGCEREPPTTKSTTTTTTTTTTPKPYLHGHPYVVIKLHEVKGTPRVRVDRISPLPPYLRQLLVNGTSPEKAQLARNISSYLPDYRIWMRGGSSEAAGDVAIGGASGSQLKSKKQRQQQQRSRSRRVPAYAAETAALKREVAGNLMRVLRTIRALDAIAQKPQQDEQQLEEAVQEQEEEPEPQQQDTLELVAPDTAGQIDQLLRRRDKSQGLRSRKKWTTEYPDELKENQAEEGDLHQFSILLKKALDELSVSPGAKARTTTTKSRKAAAVYR
ncbi:uncharacterized protein [Dermacentor andersoni]|uniref:uncharacterized protein n=1 Tax=Dermacentor andersoni TaxID=34620 RepID=UPI002154FAD2|nr:PH domain-containing protein DDB_G0287875-like [Dermacentor andersoni]